MITQAFVLAAGLGTRLRPLTDELPKPLVPIFQKPLITFALDHLIATGIRRFVVNTHRLPHLFERHFAEKNYRGCPLDLLNEPELLETSARVIFSPIVAISSRTFRCPHSLRSISVLGTTSPLPCA